MKNKNQFEKIKTNKATRKGFTLLEAMVAICVFSLVSVMVSGAFVSFLKAYKTERSLQKNTESTQYVLNLMAKTLRTSTIYDINAGGLKQIRAFDNSSRNCLIYQYDVAAKKMKYNATSAADVGACNWPVMAAALIDLSSNDNGVIENAFFVGTSSATPLFGKVTMTFFVKGNSANFPIQTSVSLRK